MAFEILVPPLITVVNASGVALSQGIGPAGYGEEWEVERYSVSLSTGFGTCRVFRNVISVQGQIDFTLDGDDAISENNSIRLKVGERMFFQWSGATTGAIATAVISGIRHATIW